MLKLNYEGKYINHWNRDGYEFVTRNNASGIVGIVAVTPGFEVVLIEQFREPIQRVCIEIPAGLVGDDTAFNDETFISAAKRELFEETGYSCDKYEVIGDLAISPGLSTEVMTIVVGSNATKTGEGGGEESEDIRKVFTLPILSAPAQIMSLADDEKILDCKVLAACLFGVEHLSKSMPIP